VGGQTRCRSGRRLHQRVIRHRRLTLHVSLSFIFATPFTSTNFATKPDFASKRPSSEWHSCQIRVWAVIRQVDSSSNIAVGKPTCGDLFT
jgi:hypothetical protein